MLQEKALAYLAAHHVMTLSTHDAGGPWAAPVFFAGDGLRLYFVSNPATRHGRAIGAGARVAGVITEDYGDWQAIRGIQLEGWCAPVPAADQVAATAVFLAKYPFAAAFLDPAGPLYEKAGRQAVFYCLQPDRICMTDNPAGFGHRECMEM